MAFKLLIVACALTFVVVKANFGWENNGFPFQVPTFRLQPFQINFPKINFPKLPSVDEIIEESKNNPNANVNAVSVSSSSSSKLGPDGKVIKTGGTTVLTSNNGKTHVIHYDDNGNIIKETSSTPSPNADNKKEDSKPDIPATPITIPEVVIPPIAIPEIPVWQPFDFMKPVMDTVNTNMNNIGKYQALANKNGKFQAVVAKSDDGGYQAAITSSNGGGNFASSSSSFSSGTSNINGVATGGGVASTSYNVNGKTGGKTFIYTV